MLKKKHRSSTEQQVTYHLEAKLINKIRSLAREHNTFLSEIARAVMTIGLPILEKQLEREKNNRKVV